MEYGVCDSSIYRNCVSFKYGVSKLALPAPWFVTLSYIQFVTHPHECVGVSLMYGVRNSCAEFVTRPYECVGVSLMYGVRDSCAEFVTRPYESSTQRYPTEELCMYGVRDSCMRQVGDSFVYGD